MHINMINFTGLHFIQQALRRESIIFRSKTGISTGATSSLSPAKIDIKQSWVKLPDTIFSCVKRSIRKMSQDKAAGVTLMSIIDFMETFAPKDLAEKWDNTGLLIESETKRNVKNILLTNDLTENVVKEAVLAKTDLIVAYHPPIFQPLKSVTTSTWKERIIGACFENRISVYSPHTRWDNLLGGVNDWLASAFDYESITSINSSSLAGRYLKLREEITLMEAANKVKNLIVQPHLQIAIARGKTLESKIKDIAVCAGSGNSILHNNSAQLYITGEMSHHSLLDAVHCGSSVILCNHSNSERGFLKVFKEIIEKNFNTINIVISKEDKDPLQFV